MSDTFKRVLLGLLIILGATVAARADDAESPVPKQFQFLFSQPHYIPQGLVTFDTYGSYSSQPAGTREQLYSGVAGLNYYFLNNNSIGFEALGAYGSQPIQDVGAVGLGFILRTHLIVQRNWSLLIDFAPRIYEASHAFPHTGTDFNFAFNTGIGATFHLRDNLNLLTGIRYMHLSNARLQGPEHNPSMNAIEGYLGLLIQL